MDSFKCDFCSGGEYVIENGLYFCDECGTQSQNHREIEFDMNQTTDFRTGYQSFKIAKKEVETENDPQKLVLTSWEEQNYILLGYTEFLIEMGAPKSLKLTVLQLWATYLKHSEAAFFDKDKAEPPRIYFCGHQNDVRILTNQRRKRPTSSKGSSKGSTVSFNTRRRIKSVLKYETNVFLEADYQSFMADNQTDLSKSLASLSFTSNASSHVIMKKTGIILSRRAKKVLKAKYKMNRQAIRNYTKKIANFEPVTSYKVVNGSDIFEFSRFKILIVILAVALNVKKSEIYISDLVRFVREGHLMKIEQYFPENIPKENLQLCYSINTFESPTHFSLMESASDFCRILYVHPEMPNFTALCEKFVEELYLPASIMKYINRLLSLCPPKMTCDYQFRPYEARAMGYIIFVLKLIFGLNDHTETLMSESAANVNKFIERKKIESKQLFVWDEWAKYIEMRRIIISECYNNSSYSYSTTFQGNMKNYSEYLIKKHEDVDVNTLAKRIKNLKSFFDKLKLNDDVEYSKLPSFDPTLTPYKTYMEVILEHKRQNDNFATIIPEEMYTSHPMRSLIPFVRPKALVDAFAASHTGLKIKLVENVMDNIKFVLHKINTIDGMCKSFVTLIKDCAEEEWIEEIKNKHKVVKNCINNEFELCQNLQETVIERNESIQACRETELLEKTQNVEEPEVKLTSITMVPNKLKPRKIIERNILEDIHDAAPCQLFNSADCDKYGSNQVDFFINNFDYWVNKMSFCDSLKDRLGAFTRLPKNFQFLLDECGRILDTDPSHIYTELNIIENYFIYVLQPINGKETIDKFDQQFYRKSFIRNNINRLHDLY